MAERTLREVLAAGVKQARQRQGFRQEDAASRARAYGLSSWIRGTVAQAEVGARRFALEEVLLLALAFESNPAEFIAGDENELVELTPDARLTVGALRALLSGDLGRVKQLPAEAVDVPARGGTATRRTGRFPEVLAEAGRFGIDQDQLTRATEDIGDAERHAAHRLGTTPERVNLAAMRRWGHTLAEERDHRLSEKSADLSARSRQALRGHITRDLLTELEAEFHD